MGRLRGTTALLTLLAATASCAAGTFGSGDDDSANAASSDYGFRTPSPLQSPTSESHEPRIVALRDTAMPNMRVHVVYIGRPGEDAPANGGFDPFITWLLASDHWGNLAEYGVHAGAFVDSVYVPAERFFAKGSIEDGLVEDVAFEELARRWMPRSQGPLLPRDGADAELAPGAEGYVFFLPTGVNVAMGKRGTYTYSTCVDALGYHRFNGREPYAVIGACPTGRTGFVVSHELAEMATDPIVGQGFFSTADLSKSGGEVADLCRTIGPVAVEGHSVTRYWSNRKGGCVPKG